jgi:hypothetical protein
MAPAGGLKAESPFRCDGNRNQSHRVMEIGSSGHGSADRCASSREDILYAESVLQRSPGLLDEVGLPWEKFPSRTGTL